MNSTAGQGGNRDDASGELIRYACPQDEGHASSWTSILLNKPGSSTLATFTKRIAHKGFASKRGPSNRNVMNWANCFLLLQYPFLSYFASNDPATRCLGVVYVAPPCSVRRLPFYPGKKHVLQIKPCVRRNLHHKTMHDDEDNYYFSFEDEETCATWEAEILSEMDRGVREALGDDAADGLHAPSSAAPLSLNSIGLKDAATMLKTLSAPYRDTLGAQLDAMEDDEEDAVVAAAKSAAMVDSLATTPRSEQRDDVVSNRSRSSSGAVSRSSSRRSGTTLRSSILPRYDEVATRRRSFFAGNEVMDCHNCEVVHRTHCSRCKASPVVGFLYTCVVCEDCEICASCFRQEDHDLRHLFLVSPDIEGECIRLLPPLEGGPFRVTELIVFEALFRIVGNDFDGRPTKPMSKRRLHSFWNAIGEGGDISGTSVGPIGAGGKKGAPASPTVQEDGNTLSLPPELLLSEKDLTLLCRDADTVTFQEFMFLVRCKLASQSAYHFLCGAMYRRLHRGPVQHGSPSGSGAPVPLSHLPPEGSFLYVAVAFTMLTRMLQAHRHGEQEPAAHGVTGPSSEIKARALLQPYDAMVRAIAAGGDHTAAWVSEPPVPAQKDVAMTASAHASANPKAQPIGAVAVTALEEATLQMLLGACSVVPLEATEEQIPLALYTQLLRSVHHACHTTSEAPLSEEALNKEVAEDFSPENRWLKDDEEELLPVSSVRERILSRWSRCAAAVAPNSTPAECRALSHRFVDVVEHVLCYDVGGALGLYSDQMESIHPTICDGCDTTPIVGFLYKQLPHPSAAGDEGGAQGVHDSNLPEDELLQFCQQCMSNKKWVHRAAEASAVASGRRGAKSHGTIRLVRLPGDVATTYDIASGKATSAVAASKPAHHSSRRRGGT